MEEIVEVVVFDVNLLVDEDELVVEETDEHLVSFMEEFDCADTDEDDERIHNDNLDADVTDDETDELLD